MGQKSKDIIAEDSTQIYVLIFRVLDYVSK